MLMQFLNKTGAMRATCPTLGRKSIPAFMRPPAKDPRSSEQYVFAAARNLLINRMRHGQVVPIEAASDLEALEIAADAPGPEQFAIARDELRHLQAALDRLPPRAREVILLRRVEGCRGPKSRSEWGSPKERYLQHLEHAIRALGRNPGRRSAFGSEDTMNDPQNIEAERHSGFAAREFGDWNDAVDQEFQAWINQTVLHRVAYLRLEEGWLRTERLAALKSARIQSSFISRRTVHPALDYIWSSGRRADIDRYSWRHGENLFSEGERTIIRRRWAAAKFSPCSMVRMSN